MTGALQDSQNLYQKEPTNIMDKANPLTRLSRRLIVGANLTAAVGLVLTALLHRFLYLDLGLVLSAILLAETYVVTKRRSPLRVLIIVDLGLIFLTTWIDHSWVSALYSAVLAALSIPLLYVSAKKLSSDASLSEGTITALASAGVTLAQSVDGWSAATRHDQVFMIREITKGYGTPSSWAVPARYYNQLRPALESAGESGITPSALFVVADGDTLYRGPRYHIVSLSKLTEYFRSGSAKKSKTSRGPAQRVRHEGRVTRKVG